MAGENEFGDHTGNGDVPPTVEVALESNHEETKTRWGLIAGTGALILVLFAGAIAISNSSSEIDTAQDDPTEQSVDESNNDDADVPDIDTLSDGAAIANDGGDDAVDFVEDAASDFAFFGGGPSSAVFDGERFVSLSMDFSGWVLRTSTDGLDWVETPVDGLSNNGYINSIEFTDGRYVVAVDAYNDNGSEQSIASSADGISWQTVSLPDPKDGLEPSLNSFAVRDGQVLVLRSLYQEGPDEYLLLMESGLLSEEQLNYFCGLDVGQPGEPIGVQICSEFDREFEGPSEEEIDELAARYDAATSDEERAAIEDELSDLYGESEGLETVATIEPSDPLYDELSAIYTSDFESNEIVQVLSGSVTGPFSVVHEFDQAGYSTGLVATDDAFFASFDLYDETSGSQSSVLRSSDGASWQTAGSTPAANGGQLNAVGSALFFMSYDDFGGSTNFVSTDSGASWSPSPLSTDLFSSYTQFVDGEAGIVAFTMGFLDEDPFSEGQFEEQEVELEKDGFNLTISWFDGSHTLRGSDGSVIADLTGEDIYEGESELVRMNPISGDLTFVDVETGDALVTFGQDDFEEAYSQFDEEFYESDFVEPESGVELNFSTDGVTWTSLDASAFGEVGNNSSVWPLAVGDDEAIFVVMIYAEPPEELFEFEIEGREPTEAEIEALELWEGGQDTTEFVRVELG